MTLHLCQSGYETFLIQELGGAVEKTGSGWVSGPEGPGDLCFAHLSFQTPTEVQGKSLNALAGAMADYFTSSSIDERFEGFWPFCVESSGVPGLSRRAQMAATDCLRRVKSRMSRVAKLAVCGRPSSGPARGFFAYLPAFDRAFVARAAVAGGQRRMADDPQAPSRSYLKVEEAYRLLAREPQAGETVVDLGAAPGGWSYSAAKREALVIAVDNGPLKGGALHSSISHRVEDAFKFMPASPADWLFCDMLEDPDRIIELLAQWLDRGWCRRFIVNLKFGRHDPLRVLRRAGRLRSQCSLFRARHLFHDREELTIVGERAL